MPKQKTHKGVSKRVRLTATGKIKRGRANRSHLMSSKSGKRRRQLRQRTLVIGPLSKAIRDRI